MRILPRTLSSRLIVVAAASVLIAQIISFGLQMRIHQHQRAAMAVTPAVLRILDHAGLPSVSFEPPGVVRMPVRLSRTRPELPGHPAPELAERAREMLANGGVVSQDIIVRLDHDRMPRHPMLSVLTPDINEPPVRDRLHLAVQTGPDRWVIVSAPAPGRTPPYLRGLIVQTLLIYALVLVPLLWFGHRLSAPLKDLTGAANAYSPRGPAPLLSETGPEDVRNLTRSFNDMWSRIGAMMAEKDHMLGAIGHDLRTPLASLRIRAESIDDDAERAQFIASIDEMHQMLEDILALARAGRERAPPQNVNLAALVEAVTDDFAETGAPVRTGPCERAIAAVHVSGMRRAIRNLIDNAVKYGGGATVSVTTSGREAIIAVEDEGPGIDPVRMAEMLEPFTRLEGSRNRDTGGAGLGLALVRAVIMAEGGRIELSNRTDRPDGGTGLSARLVLPLA
jgi:signal transduction histidine kinase